MREDLQRKTEKIMVEGKEERKAVDGLVRQVMKEQNRPKK